MDQLERNSTETPEFLKAINSGSREAYDALFRVYYESMLLYALKILPYIEAAEDVVQGVFVSIWEHRVQFDHHKSIKRYLLTAVKNAALSLLRHPRHSHISLDDVHGLTMDIEEVFPFVEEEIYSLMFDAIDRLPDRCREVMLLSLDGKTNFEIADMLGVSVDTVKTQKQRAKAKLSKLLGKT